MRVRVRGTAGDTFEQLARQAIALAPLVPCDVEVEANGAVIKAWADDTVSGVVDKICAAIRLSQQAAQSGQHKEE